MADNTLAAKSPGDVVQSDDPNQFRTAMNGNIVPRVDGVALDEGGSLGESSKRFTNLFLSGSANIPGDVNSQGKIKFGTTENGLSIEDDGGEIVLKVAGTVVGRFNANGLTSLILPNEVSGGVVSHVNTSTSYTDIAGTSVQIEITQSTHKVLLLLEPIPGSNGFIGTSFRGNYRMLRAAVNIYETEVQGAIAQGGGDFNAYPSSSIMAYDLPGVGTHTYKLQSKTFDGAYPVSTYNCRLRALAIP